MRSVSANNEVVKRGNYYVSSRLVEVAAGREGPRRIPAHIGCYGDVAGQP
jgi:hypothetical protein